MKNNRIWQTMTKSIAISLLAIAISLNAYGQNSINGHECVDLGLSVLWATCNVGASNPSDNGSYFAWGETSTKSEYTKENSKTYNLKIGKIGGNASYDAARVQWGYPWRLPTKAEMKELLNKCQWQWMTQDGKNGYKITGPNGNSIFLPAAGRWMGAHLVNEDNFSFYWSSNPDGKKHAKSIFCHGIYQYINEWVRYDGCSIRPVAK